MGYLLVYGKTEAHYSFLYRQRSIDFRLRDWKLLLKALNLLLSETLQQGVLVLK
jgi:hypothetical protein